MAGLGIAPPGVSGRGGAFDYTYRFLGGLVQEQESYPIVTGVSTPIVSVNADRVGLIIMNIAGIPVYLSLLQNLSTVNSQFITPNGGALILNVTEDFTLCARAWNGIVVSGSAQLYVLEVIRILQPSQVGPR
jgi:hypothetical protein